MRAYPGRVRTRGKGSGMKKPKIILPAVGVLFALLLIAILWIQKGSDRKESFSQEYVLAKELPALFSFTYYNTEEWERQLKETVRGKLSYRELSDLLSQLGVEEYVTYDERAGFRSVSRKVFFAVYEEVRDILEPITTVTDRVVVFFGQGE